MVKLLACLLAAAACCSAQQTQTPPPLQPPQPAGVENPWDVRTIVNGLLRDTGDLKPLLDGLAPQQWVDRKGAPTTYILQWQTAEQQLKDVLIVSKSLAQKTDSLSLGLDEYFRLEALDVTLRSLEDGIRRYAERPAADKLSAMIARNFGNRERLRNYLRELAASTEQNFKIADEEAQRCRGIISKEPKSAAKRTRR